MTSFDKHEIARYTSLRNRWWVSVYLCPDGTYSYQSDNGGGWSHDLESIRRVVANHLADSPTPMKLRFIDKAHWEDIANGHD